MGLPRTTIYRPCDKTRDPKVALMPARTGSCIFLVVQSIRSTSLQLLDQNMETHFSSPISVGSYPRLSALFLLSGFASTAAYFVFQLRGGNKSLATELLIGALASFFLGFGTLFAMLSFGLFV